MKKLMMKLSPYIAMLALVAATINVNTTCMYRVYQEPVPEAAKKLSKIK